MVVRARPTPDRFQFEEVTATSQGVTKIRTTQTGRFRDVTHTGRAGSSVIDEQAEELRQSRIAGTAQVFQRVETTEGRQIVRARGESFDLRPGEQIRATGAQTFIFAGGVPRSRAEAAILGQDIVTVRPGASFSASFAELERQPLVQAPFGRGSLEPQGTITGLGKGPTIGPGTFSALTRSEERTAARITRQKATRTEAARRSEAGQREQELSAAELRFAGLSPAEKIGVRASTLLSGEGFALVGAEISGQGEKVAARKLAADIRAEARRPGQSFKRGATQFFESPIFAAEASFAAPIVFQAVRGPAALAAVGARFPTVAKGAQIAAAGMFVGGTGLSIGQDIAEGRQFSALGRGLFAAAEVPLFFAGAAVSGKAAAGKSITGAKSQLRGRIAGLERQRAGLRPEVSEVKVQTQSTFAISQRGDKAIGSTRFAAKTGSRVFSGRVGSQLDIKRLPGDIPRFESRGRAIGEVFMPGKKQPLRFGGKTYSLQAGELSFKDPVSIRGAGLIQDLGTGKRSFVLSRTQALKKTEIFYTSKTERVSLLGRQFDAVGRAGTISLGKDFGFERGPRLSGASGRVGASELFRLKGGLSAKGREISPDIIGRRVKFKSPGVTGQGQQIGESFARAAAKSSAQSRLVTRSLKISRDITSTKNQLNIISGPRFKAKLGTRLAPTQIFATGSRTRSKQRSALQRLPGFRQQVRSGFDIAGATRGRTRTAARTEFDVFTRTRTFLGTRTTTGLKSGTRTVQSSKTSQVQLTGISGTSFGRAGRSPGFSFDLDIPPIKPSIKVPGLPAIRPRGQIPRRKKGKRVKPFRPFKYTTTLTAAAFDIRGPRPTRLTGFEVRPGAPRSARRRKK